MWLKINVANEFEVHEKGGFNSLSVVCLVVSYVQHVGSISLSTTPEQDTPNMSTQSSFWKTKGIINSK